MSLTRARLRLPLVIAFAVLALGAVACDSSSDIPTADELQGIWVEADSGTIRAFEFTAITRTYNLYLYDDGAPPVVNQSGTYSIDGSRLITEVDSALDASIVHQAFANAILGFTGSTLTLHSDSAADGKRTFTRADALP